MALGRAFSVLKLVAARALALFYDVDVALAERSTRPFSPATGASPPLRDMARESSWRERRRRLNPA